MGQCAGMSPELRLSLKADVRRVGGQVVGQKTPRERPALISRRTIAAPVGALVMER
jgi:hypothetical protein